MSLALPENVEVLGDPHLGRRFKTGVPLHRVGEREASVWRDFENSLFDATKPFHVMMGDLFDKFVVPPEVVLRAADTYYNAAHQNPGTTYIVLMGNHDVSRDTSKGSSFDLFAALVDRVSNIVVVKDAPVTRDRFGFVPYSAFTPTADLVAELPDDLEAVFGHWDIQDWGGDNVIPTAVLSQKNIPLAISGHDHLARDERFHGVDVIVTGSMQPYTHAEDDCGYLYVTVHLEDLEVMDVSGKNVRVLLREGETLPADLDCLSLTAKRDVSEDDTIEIDASEYEGLDLKTMLAGVLKDFACRDTLLEKFEEIRID